MSRSFMAPGERRTSRPLSPTPSRDLCFSTSIQNPEEPPIRPVEPRGRTRETRLHPPPPARPLLDRRRRQVSRAHRALREARRSRRHTPGRRPPPTVAPRPASGRSRRSSPTAPLPDPRRHRPRRAELASTSTRPADRSPRRPPRRRREPTLSHAAGGPWRSRVETPASHPSRPPGALTERLRPLSGRPRESRRSPPREDRRENRHDAPTVDARPAVPSTHRPPHGPLSASHDHRPRRAEPTRRPPRRNTALTRRRRRRERRPDRRPASPPRPAPDRPPRRPARRRPARRRGELTEPASRPRRPPPTVAPRRAELASTLLPHRPARLTVATGLGEPSSPRPHRSASPRSGPRPPTPGRRPPPTALDAVAAVSATDSR